MSFQQHKKRAMTPKGQMSGNGSGPAIMMMPAHIRATFMPDPPVKHLPPFRRKELVADTYEENDSVQSINAKSKGSSGIATIASSFPRKKLGSGLSGVASFINQFERTEPPARKVNPTPKSIKEEKKASMKAENDSSLKPLIEKYREEQKASGGEFSNGMNCYNTLFLGRLAYEVTERKLLREFEAYGPVKDLKLVTDPRTKKSRGYGFVEFEREDDMKRAFRAADGMRIEGRAIVVDVERGHTVPNWLPRRLGGGLGGTRLGGKGKNVTVPGRFDPSRAPPPPAEAPMGGGLYGGLHSQYGGGHGNFNHGHDRGGYGGPPSYGNGGGGAYGGGRMDYNRGGSFQNGPPGRSDRDDRDRKRRRSRSRSPDRRRRSRY